jgi:hypothetical protein
MRELDFFTQLNQQPQQQKFLETISASRDYLDNSILNAYRAIYIPNHQVMIEMLQRTSIYRLLFTPDNRSFIPGKLLIPGFSPLGHLVTYAAYDPIARAEAKESGVYGKAYYFYPDASTGFIKSNFLLMPFEMWEVALRTRKIGVADGVFDAGSVSSCGIPCASNLGTALGKGVKRILSIFDEVSLYKDNDSAGSDLYIDMVKNLKNLNLVHVPYEIGKDIDGYITKMGKEAFIAAILPTGKVDLPSRRLSRL